MEVSFKYLGSNEYVSGVEGKEPIYIKGPEDKPSRRFTSTEFLLFAMASCSSSDVLSILEKKKVLLKSFECRIIADRNSEHPKTVRNANITYILEGDSIDPEKVRRAINLSLNKYCSVSILAIRGGANVTYSFTINGKIVDDMMKPALD